MVCHEICVISNFNVLFVCLGDSKRSPGGTCEYKAREHLELEPLWQPKHHGVSCERGRSILVMLCHEICVISNFNVLFVCFRRLKAVPRWHLWVSSHQTACSMSLLIRLFYSVFYLAVCIEVNRFNVSGWLFECLYHGLWCFCVWSWAIWTMTYFFH
jgi:hypothetical protein